MTQALYDRIGGQYTATRRPDPSIAAAILDELGDADFLGTFDAALAVLTIHHWVDWRRGLDEMKRVANRVVVFTFEPNHLGNSKVTRIPVPHDCVDGFLGAFWRRPEAYLDPRVRAGMSGFALLDPKVVARGVARLKSDLESETWEQRFGYLRSFETLDVGYRLLVTN